MNFSTFIFSRNRRIILARHTLFWVAWISFYSVTTILWRMDKLPLSKNIPSAITEVFLSTAIDMYYCYAIIYFLIPRFFFKARFREFFFLWLLHNGVALALFRLFTLFVRPLVQHLYATPVVPPAPFTAVALNLFISIGFEGCMAAAIVLGKYWYKTNQHLLRVKKEHRKVLNRMKWKEQFVMPYPILQTIWQEAAYTYSLEGFGETAVQPDPSTAFVLIEKAMQHAQTPLIALEEELQSVILYHDLKKSNFSNFEYEGPVTTDNFEITSNLLLSLASLPFLNSGNLRKENPLLLKIRVKEDVLCYELSWTKKDNTDILNKQQYEALTYLKSTIEFNYPSSNEFYLVANGNEVDLKVCLNLKQHI